MRLHGGLLAEQQRAAHVHVGDDSTYAETDGEPNAGAVARADARADTEPNAEPNAAPVR